MVTGSAQQHETQMGKRIGEGNEIMMLSTIGHLRKLFAKPQWCTKILFLWAKNHRKGHT